MILRNCNFEEFIKRLNGRKVICFGAGSFLNKQEDGFRKNIKNLEENIAFFIDNDNNKAGNIYEYRGKSFKICSVDILDKINVDDYVILITCLSFIDICVQLDNIKNLDNIECYIHRMITDYESNHIDKFLQNKKFTYILKNWSLNLKKLNLKNKHKGKRCFIIGNGPSLRLEDLNLLKNEITFAVNRIYLLFNKTEWRPTYYMFADQIGYSKDYHLISNIQSEITFVPYTNVIFSNCFYDNITYYKEEVFTTTYINKELQFMKKQPFSYDITDTIYSGPTILYEAVQIAVYMGFSEIYLLGVDCNFDVEILPDGTIKKNNIQNHFTKEYDNGLENIIVAGVESYKQYIAWQSAKEACEKVGVTIKNATRGGKLEVFERVDFDELMNNK